MPRKGAVAVLSMMRAQMRYVIRSRYAAVFGIVFACMCAFEAAAIWMHLHVPWFTELGIVVGIHDGVPSLALWGSSFVGGSLIAMLFSIFMASMASEFFKHGYVKNMIQARGGRASYALAFVALCVLLSAAMTVVGVVVTETGVRIAGVAPALPSIGDFFQWLTQVILCVTAYAVLTVLVVFVTKSEVAGVIAALFFGGGGVEGLMMFVLANVPGMPAAIRDCLDGYLAADVSTLGAGGICDPLSYAQSVGTILVVGALCVLVMRRRSLG